MNLIEQLGGYERAKHEFEMIKEMQPLCPDEVKNNERMLLEYRRANNIYEVGDKIIFDVMGNSVMEYADCLNMFLSQSLIRHATDAEIKAGKRLEVV